MFLLLLKDEMELVEIQLMYLKSNIYEANNSIFNLDASLWGKRFRTKAGLCTEDR